MLLSAFLLAAVSPSCSGSATPELGSRLDATPVVRLTVAWSTSVCVHATEVQVVAENRAGGRADSETQCVAGQLEVALSTMGTHWVQATAYSVNGSQVALCDRTVVAVDESAHAWTATLGSNMTGC